MIGPVLLALAAPFLGSAVQAPAPVSADQRAVLAYRRGDLETARSLWLAELEGSRAADAGEDERARLPAAERGRILYDLGNVAFRAGKPLEAVGWYSASLRLRPRDGDAWRNLEHARAAARLEPADRGDLAATVWRLFTGLTPAESEWLALLGAGAWALCLAAEALRGGRLASRLALAGAVVALASLTPWLYHLSRGGFSRGGPDTVMVVDASEGGAKVHSEPRADAAVIGTAAAGEEVRRLDELPGWVKVEVAGAGGAGGWIESAAAFPLKR